MTSVQLISSPSPDGLTAEQQVLWLAHHNQWENAHDLAQDIASEDGSWLHAYLHRQEDDLSNAAYWYARANRPTPPQNLSLEDEWHTLAAHFCG